MRALFIIGHNCVSILKIVQGVPKKTLLKGKEANQLTKKRFIETPGTTKFHDICIG